MPAFTDFIFMVLLHMINMTLKVVKKNKHHECSKQSSVTVLGVLLRGPMNAKDKRSAVDLLTTRGGANLLGRLESVHHVRACLT